MKSVLLFLFIVATSFSAQAATPQSYVGKPPQLLLKSAPEFAKAYRQATHEVDLPVWTKRLAAGQPAEIVEIGGNQQVLSSACGKGGCLDERIYILFDPATKTATGFFFLPPADDDPGDSRTAFSQWLGKPGKEASDFLLERAINDARSLNKPNY
jgi:hypothetical protein